MSTAAPTGASKAPTGRLLVAAVSGCAVLVLEFAAIRLFAPAFGQSSYVWSTVIGLILAALAAGYWFGGRLGDRATGYRPLALAHALAGLWVFGCWAIGAGLSRGLIPTGLPEDGLLPLAFWGSLAATAVLFVPPAFLLGMTSPFLIRFQAKAGTTGRAAGSIYAAGTVGSLIGCFLAPLVLLQTLGTHGTLLTTGGVLWVLAGIGALGFRGRVAPTPGPEGGQGTVRPVLLALSLGIGFLITVVEFTAVRFMGPWFGQSNHIWANVIGVLMLALALGSWIGGRRADRAADLAPLRHALLLAGGILALVSLLGPAIFGWLVPDSLASIHILPAARWGSLAATALLLGPPLLLLGMATPLLVKEAGRYTNVGHGAGAILASGTVGGLLGCLLTPTLLVPGIGSFATLLVCAIAAGLLACVPVGAGAPRNLRLVAGSLGAVGVLLLVVRGGAPLREHDGQIVEVESKYQTVRVVADVDALLLPTPQPAFHGPTGRIPIRFLRHDEDAETFQSTFLRVPTDRIVETWNYEEKRYERKSLPPRPGGHALTGGQYFEHMAIGAHYVDRPASGPLRVLIIGYAGGTVHRVLRETRPHGLALDVLGVEIDPAVVDVANDYLGHAELAKAYTSPEKLPGDRLRIVTGEDGRTVVNALPDAEVFDLILVDAYARTNYLPFQLASREFFHELRDHLSPRGWIGVNVLGDGTKSPVAKSVAMTMSLSVGDTYIAPNASFPGNVMLWTRPGAVRGPRVGRSGLTHLLMRRAAYSTERLVIRYDPRAEKDARVVVLTDDRSPSDRLADEELGL